MVVETSSWPRSSSTVRMSYPRSTRWVAKLWRRGVHRGQLDDARMEQVVAFRKTSVDLGLSS